jgi:hypothetical protein
MASIRLRGRETDRGRLPKVCIICGGQATERLRKRFSWHPPWVIVLIVLGLLPYAIVAMALTESISVDVPLCSQHKRYWLTKFGWFFASFAAILLVGIGSLVLAYYVHEKYRIEIGGWVCGFVALGMVVWLIAIFLLQLFALRPIGITEDSITFANAHPEFVEAVQEARRKRAEMRSLDFDDDDDFEPPRRRGRRDRANFDANESEPAEDETRFRRKRDGED